MIDIQFIRDNPELVQRKTEEKGYRDINIVELLKLDEKRRDILTQVEELRAQRNILTAEMKGAKPSPEQIEKGRALREKIADGETALKNIDDTYWPALKAVPNMSLDMVPVGDSEDYNVVVRTYGEKRDFDFTPEQHWEIAEAKG